MTQTHTSLRSHQVGAKRPAYLGLALLFCLFCAPLLHAQVLYGILTGTVTDPTGAAVPDATVTVRNQNTGETRTVKTNGSGDYLVRDIQQGLWTVDVPAMGSFGEYKQENVTVTVNTQARINVTLQPASVKSEVTVTTAPPLLQTETAEVNHQISNTQIEQLPITSSAGRNFQALYTLIPGAAAVQEQNSTASNPSRAESANFNGTEDMGNTTRIDGAVNQYGWLPYLIAYVPPADSIQTVNITTNSFNAEQGMAGGASINVIIKTGQNQIHGSAWEYNQLFNTNARGYTTTYQATPRVPKNIFNQFGANFSGPIVIPHVVNGHNKLFFYEGFERTTRRQLISGLATVPDLQMLGGNFSEVASGLANPASNAILYDPQPGGVYQTGPNAVNGYLLPAFRPTFQSEYGSNAIPASRQSPAAVTMLQNLSAISTSIGTPNAAALNNQLSNNYFGSDGYVYNRMTNDSKVTYNLSDKTSMFGRYSIEPFNVTDPQQLGAAGGGTWDGGQPGAAKGRIQNVGLGASHVLSPSLVVDVDGGYTRQVSGAQSALDISLGNYGLNVLKIPGTNGVNQNYAGQPIFQINGFNSLGNASPANPFLFRDNQFTGDVNVSYTKGKHATRYGFTYYHFLLNHFQPTSGGNISNARGGFIFAGGMTTGPGNKDAKGNANNTNGYLSLADMLLGLPNNGTGVAVGKAYQITDPNSLRWTQIALYAQDQWTISPKLTLNYGIRYEYYPTPYRDHTGVYRLDPTLPQTANVEIGGVNGNPKNAGINSGWGMIVPRLGVAYRVTERTVLRAGGGITEDPDSLRFLRDSFPEDQSPQFSAPQNNTVAIDPTQNNLPLTLAVGIPLPPAPSLASGFVSLPINSGTTTVPANWRRGYIESWNAFLQQDLGGHFVANIGYVGTHQVRQIVNTTLNAAPLPDGTTICMANGQYNPSSRFFTHALGSNPCNFQANAIINTMNCANATSATCYNTGGIGLTQPLFSAEYNGLQTQLTRSAGRLAQFGLVYTWSHAINFTDNGGGSGGAGNAFGYPAYYAMNRANAGYDRRNNLQFWFIYHLPFGRNQMFANHGVASAVLGGFQVNGQISHISGAPFSISPANSNGFNSPGNTLYAQQIGIYRQLNGHNRTPGNSVISGGQAWFDPSAFTNPVQPVYTATQLASQVIAPSFGNTHRNQFTGPGTTNINASVFRAFHIWRESEFQVRVEAFNLLNHPQLNNPNVTVGGGTFGYITGFGATRSLQYSGRINF